MAMQKKNLANPRKGLLGLFGKVPEVDVSGFDRQRRREIARENLR